MKRMRLLLRGGLAVSPVFLASAATAFDCTLESARDLGLPGVTVTAVAPAESGAPACLVSGTAVTSDDTAPDGEARFEIRLPDDWNGRFAMFGNGGLAGRVRASANAVDVEYANDTGYVTAMTDLGHVAESSVDARFALNSDGTPNEAAVADYYYRASHVVTETAKAMAEAAYGRAPDHSYLTGCSTGGRMAQVAATRYPDDFDGVISGAPFMDISSMLKIQHFQINQLLSPDAQLLPAKLPAIEAAVLGSCDAVDGVTDGMIQDPAACSFEPETLVCTGAEDDSCLTGAQAKALRAYFTALHTDEGQLVYPGYAPVLFDSGFSLFQGGKEPALDVNAAEPWGNDGFDPAPIEWSFSDHIIQYLVKQDPTYNVRELGISPDGTVPRAVVDEFVAMTEAGNGSDLTATQAFLDSGKKMILYHGWGDHALSPFRTTRFVDDLIRREGSEDVLSEKARLFMVPGMGHCRGGAGPDTFNTLAAMEAWVEEGRAPDMLTARKFDEEGVETRAMPLCAYPARAVYDGTGDVNLAESWSCQNAPLGIGSVGISAGLLTGGEPTQ